MDWNTFKLTMILKGYSYRDLHDKGSCEFWSFPVYLDLTHSSENMYSCTNVRIYNWKFKKISYAKLFTKLSSSLGE